MIKYNNSNINDWNFDDSNIIKVYHNGIPNGWTRVDYSS